jgi:hypothetical protein
MPDHSRWMIKAGMFWLLIAVSLGLVGTLLPVEGMQWNFAPYRMAVWHTLAVGWLTQLIFGVSLWMFPGVRKRAKKKDGDATMEWIIFGLLNIGVAIRMIIQPMQWEPGIVVAGSAQWLAMLLYVIRVWPSTQAKRVRSSKRR